MRRSASTTVVAAAAGICSAVLIAVVYGIGLLPGAVGVVLFALMMVFVPSDRALSRRLALNGVIALGVIPVLWWFRWPAFGPVGHAGVIVSLLGGFLVYRLVLSSESRRALVPRAGWLDLLPFACAGAAIWLLSPFFLIRSGPRSIAMLVGGFGHDNVGHFDMFSMIRSTMVTGPLWPAAPGGSVYSYISYPQHFHVLVTFVAELWHGTSIGSVDTETGLYGIGTSIVLSGALFVLVAAIVSAPPLHGRPFLVVAVAAVAFIGMAVTFGASVLPYGFPGYLLAVYGTIIACVVTLGTATASRRSMLAVTAALVLVAQTWSLLAPIAAVPFVLAVLRLPWSSYLRNRREFVPVAFIALFAIVGGGYAAYLVYLGTHTVGSAATVLAIGGGFPPVSIGLPTLATTAVILVGATWLLRFRRVGHGVPVTRGSMIRRIVVSTTVLPLVASVAVGQVVVAGLIALQLSSGAGLGYYQYKFIFGYTMVVFVLLAVLFAARLSRVRPWSSALGAGVLAVLVVGLLVVTGQPSRTVFGIPIVTTPVASFRGTLRLAADSSHSSTARLLDAATMMRSRPCALPVYFAAESGDLDPSQANQWAMSFSGTWTEQAAPINSYLANAHFDASVDSPSAVVTHLLEQDSKRCVIVASELDLSSSTVTTFGDRIIRLR